MFTRSCVAVSIMLISLTAEAKHHTGIDISISVSPPPAQVVVSPPRGYTHCYVTRGMWIDNMWIPPHQECTYTEASRSRVWVSGYWGCVVPGQHGRCARWKWLSNHWMRGVPPQEIHHHEHGHGYTNVHEHEQIHQHGGAEVHGHEHEHAVSHEHHTIVHTR